MDLFRAVESGSFDEVVVCVEERRLDPNLRNDVGNTALHIAASKGLEKICCYLIEHGADLVAENKEGKTPVALANPRLRGVMKATKEIQEMYRRLESDTTLGAVDTTAL